VLVLREGVVHEEGATRQVFADPRSSYTRALLEASTRASRLGP
jgi:ABC-type microcin C transport system duplicated ATPase subunit YejF